MQKRAKNRIVVYHFSNLSKFNEINHFISTRQGGVSPSPYNSLNIAFHVNDKNENVAKNRKFLFNSIKLPLNNLVALKQAHGNNVVVLKESDKGKGAKNFQSAIGNADSLITNITNIPILIQVADCVPILLHDPKRRVVGAAHAGWQGTQKEIAKKTIEKLSSKFKCNPKDIIAGIGPSIGQECYGFDKKKISLFNKFDYLNEIVEYNNDAPFLNLKLANKKQLLQAGLLENNIEEMKICTKCESKKFFSHRKNRKGTGRFGAVIMLKDFEK